jgi:dihydroxyacid dehydratase/phosphogluconate dehydratase
MVRPHRPRRLHLPQLDQEPGVPHDQFDGRPVIGICNTFSELTPCNSHFRTIAEQVKRACWRRAASRSSSR